MRKEYDLKKLKLKTNPYIKKLKKILSAAEWNKMMKKGYKKHKKTMDELAK